jgi:hypothetical protein
MALCQKRNVEGQKRNALAKTNIHAYSGKIIPLNAWLKREKLPDNHCGHSNTSIHTCNEKFSMLF